MIDIHNLKLLIYNRILKGTLGGFLKPKGLAKPSLSTNIIFFHIYVVSLFYSEALSEASKYND